jgi:hypothetical protein
MLWARDPGCLRAQRSGQPGRRIALAKPIRVNSHEFKFFWEKF